MIMRLMSAIGLVFRVPLCAIAVLALSSSVDAKSCEQPVSVDELMSLSNDDSDKDATIELLRNKLAQANAKIRDLENQLNDVLMRIRKMQDGPVAPIVTQDAEASAKDAELEQLRNKLAQANARIRNLENQLNDVLNKKTNFR